MKLDKIGEVWNSANRLLSDFISLLSSINFATMAMQHNDFSSQLVSVQPSVREFSSLILRQVLPSNPSTFDFSPVCLVLSCLPLIGGGGGGGNEHNVALRFVSQMMTILSFRHKWKETLPLTFNANFSWQAFLNYTSTHLGTVKNKRIAL